MTSCHTSVSILGGRGMLGSDLAKICEQQDFEVNIFDLPEFDITNTRQLEKAVETSQIIVNCAAYTDVDGAENNSESAYKINAEAAGRLGDIARKLDKWVLHISTDFVFNGRLDRPYIETDPTEPISTYGKTKQAGEQLLEKSGCRHCILRVEWTYGSAGSNFITKMIQRAKGGKILRVVNDQIGAPTATTAVAEVVCELLRLKPIGIFHFANSGYASRFEVAQFIFEKLSMKVNVRPCKTSDYTTVAARPLNSRFNCGKISTLTGVPIEHWQIPLEHFLRNI
ncbi:MAG: dTDP-4-dehydrorhamnose reductase [Sedimentisphaerales bacterium]|nr:dTDP-4-dehydrorhamnose reductase [Sedimentisphaerales bacterium]